MKLYVLACKKLSKAQQYVQGTHAAIQYAMDNDLSRHPTLVMLTCPDIKDWAEYLDELNINHSTFNEPHYDNRLTAIAAKNIGELVTKLGLI